MFRGWVNRKRMAGAAKELANQLLLIDHVKALQTGQKELADAIASLGHRLHQIETQIRTVRVDAKLDAIHEAQTIFNAVQGSLNQRIETLAVKLAVQEARGDAASRLPAAVQEIKGDATARLPTVVQEVKGDAASRLPTGVQEVKSDAASRLPTIDVGHALAAPAKLDAGPA